MNTTYSIPVDYDPFSGPSIDLEAQVTSAQEEILLACELDKEASSAFNLVSRVELPFRADHESMAAALDWVVQRHDALRCTFSGDGTTLLISNRSPLVLPLEIGSEQDVKRAEREETRRCFDLHRGPLFSCRHFLDDEKSYLILNTHHLIADGWSVDVLLQELSYAYTCFVNGELPHRAAPPQFSTYATKLAVGELEKKAVERDLGYWKARYATVPEPLELPTARKRPRIFSGRADHRATTMPRKLLDQLNTLRKDHRCTLTTTLIALKSAYLARVTGQTDLVIGVPAAAQATSGQPDLIGHCTNVLPVRVEVDLTAPFSAHLVTVKAQMLDAFEHASISFGELIRHIKIERDLSRPTLVPVIVNIDSISDLSFAGADAKLIEAPRINEQFELFVNCIEAADGLHMDWSFASDIFAGSAMEKRISEFLTFCKSVTTDAGQPVSDFQVVPESQRRRLLTQWNDTSVAFGEGGLLDNFEKHVKAQPAKAAVSFGDRSLSYAELDALSSDIAARVRAHTAAEAGIVGLALPRSEKMLAAILGVWKAGCAYLPLDPEFPVARLVYMVEDSCVGLLITCSDKGASAPIPEFTGPTLDLADLGTGIREQHSDVVTTPAQDQLAYMIYTSGSTGKPKGVRVNHAQLTNFLHTMCQQPGLSENDVLLAVTTLSFDISILELMLPLFAGATVRIADKNTTTDPQALARELDEHAVSVLQATPSTWQMLLEDGWHGKSSLTGLCGGEALPQALASNLVQRVGSLWNMYGPTETTIWSTCQLLTQQDNIVRIGKPIANTQVYVLDAYQQLVPVGVAGELYIGGEGVTQGYHRRSELTAKRFVSLAHIDQASRLYRTGDLVRWNDHGELEYLRRLDTQVKLRGFRIELGEIESVVASVPGVLQCAAAVVNVSEADRRLVVYYTSEGTDDLEAAVQDKLKARLPHYMNPQHLLRLNELPLAANGKVDRKRLPRDILTQTAGDAEPPAGEAEEFLAMVWSDVLGQPVVDRHANFFHTGGHSLLAMQVCSRVRNDLGLEVPFRSVFEHPVLSEFAGYLEEALVSKLES